MKRVFPISVLLASVLASPAILAADPIPGIDITGEPSFIEASSSPSDGTTPPTASSQNGEDIILRKKPGRNAEDQADSSSEDTRATDYNSSRSNRSTNN